MTTETINREPQVRQWRIGAGKQVRASAVLEGGVVLLK